MPQYVVPSLDIAKFWALYNPATFTIHIIDFGESWESCEPRSPLPRGRRYPGTPTRVATPELLHRGMRWYEKEEIDNEVTASVDIWTLACTIFELFGNRPLFRMVWGDRNEVIADIVALLGMLPERWWRDWAMGVEWGKYWFTADGQPIGKRAEERVELTLEKRVGTMRGEDEGLGESDEGVLLRLLSAVLKFEPTERATAAELLEMLPAEWERGEPGYSKPL
jgi:serine/threonine protein kinase